MKNEEMKEIYQIIDSRIKRNLEAYQKFVRARKPRYTYFSEYLHIEYQTRTGRNIIEEMERAGIEPIRHSYLWTMKNRVSELMEDKIPLVPEDKICYQCRTPKRQRKVAPGNFALCRICDPKNRKVTQDESFTVENNCAY